MLSRTMQVRQWVSMWEGSFTTQDLCDAFGLFDEGDKVKIRVALKRLCDRGIIKREIVKIGHETVIVPGHFYTL